MGAIVAGGDPTRLTAGTIGTLLTQAAVDFLDDRIDTTDDFDELNEALDRSQSGRPRGKLLVTGPTT